MGKQTLHRLKQGLITGTVALFVCSPIHAQDGWVLVQRAPLIEEVRLDGRIEAVQQSTVSAQTSGTIIELPVDVDDVVGALFILTDPIFSGLAISLIFGLAVSTVLTVLAIPLLYYSLAKTYGIR
jgi:hypothetical protein